MPTGAPHPHPPDPPCNHPAQHKPSFRNGPSPGGGGGAAVAPQGGGGGGGTSTLSRTHPSRGGGAKCWLVSSRWGVWGTWRNSPLPPPSKSAHRSGSTIATPHPPRRTPPKDHTIAHGASAHPSAPLSTIHLRATPQRGAIGARYAPTATGPVPDLPGGGGGGGGQGGVTPCAPQWEGGGGGGGNHPLHLTALPHMARSLA